MRLQDRLLAWYDRERRVLPWRERPEPYRVWVSEIMLQQTQVATVVPYYERFLRRFPSVAALARAPEEEVLKLWAGLGYYSRARNLRRAAVELVAKRGGRLPEDPEALRALPGIGRYTAAAIASIAFGRPHELVDGNVIRVLARLYALRGDPKGARLQERVWEKARLLLHRARPGDWNQALMELGARVCLPAPDSPRCGECPLARDCAARARGLQERLPAIAAKRAPVALAWTALRIARGDRLLLWRRSAGERFLPEHWALPEARHLPAARPGRALATVRHSITHHRITLTVREAVPPPAPLPGQARWTAAGEARGLLVSSLWLKALRARLLAALFAGSAAAGPFDLPETPAPARVRLSGLFDFRATHTSQAAAWLLGGTNRLRYGGKDADGDGVGDRDANALAVSQASLLVDAEAREGFALHAQLNLTADTESGGAGAGRASDSA